MSRLPADIRMEWAREGEGHDSEIDWLLEFLKENKRRERSQTFRDSRSKVKITVAFEKRAEVHTTAALQSS